MTIQNYLKRICAVMVFSGTLTVCAQNNGPLRVDPKNPRYFTDNSGKAILLAGSHTWSNFQDMLYADNRKFDLEGYISMLKANHHNFIRFWTWEQSKYAAWTKDDVYFSPIPYARVGAGLAQDGKPKFDLTKWNEEYFRRLRERIIKYKENGIFASIMLFQGFSLNTTEIKDVDPWTGHPFNIKNNVNGVNVPYIKRDDDDNPSLHSMKNKSIVKLQEDYVKKIIDVINDQDNVLYEIINEGGAKDWQYHMIDFIKAYEKTKPKQHPVGMTHRINPKMFNEDLVNSNADWIEPSQQPEDFQYPNSGFIEDYLTDPPVNDGKKVKVVDTDHLWGHGGNYKWVWKSVLRGHNLLFMDPWTPLGGKLDENKVAWMYIGGISKDIPNYPDWELIRKNMGYARMMMDTLHLENLTPRTDLSTSRYCLTDNNNEFVFYFPEGGKGTVDLRNARGNFSVQWFFPVLGTSLEAGRSIAAGDYKVFEVPFTGDAVLVLKKINNN